MVIEFALETRIVVEFKVETRVPGICWRYWSSVASSFLLLMKASLSCPTNLRLLPETEAFSDSLAGVPAGFLCPGTPPRPTTYLMDVAWRYWCTRNSDLLMLSTERSGPVFDTRQICLLQPFLILSSQRCCPFTYSKWCL